MKTIGVSASLLTFLCCMASAETLSPPNSPDTTGPAAPNYAETSRPVGEGTERPPKKGWPQRPPPSDEKPGPVGGTPPIFATPQAP